VISNENFPNKAPILEKIGSKIKKGTFKEIAKYQRLTRTQ
jgi:hypothetical protein